MQGARASKMPPSGSCPRGQFESHFGPLRPPHAAALPLLTQLSPAEGSLRAAEPLPVNRWPSEARVEELSVDWTEVGKPSPANGGWPTNPPFCHKVRASKRRVARNPPFGPCPAWHLRPPPDECTHRVLPPVQIQCSWLVDARSAHGRLSIARAEKGESAGAWPGLCLRL